jgi:hypothetical protein
LLEEAGIPTVIIAVRAFQDRLTAMKVPRLVVTPHPMGRVIGAPGDRARQREVIEAALNMLEHATAPELFELPGGYPLPKR